MNSKYKIAPDLLKLREYGRNVQMMVGYAKQVEDRNERNALSHEIVRIMGSINPALAENPDSVHKIWDHFYFLADYDIDIDSNYPIPAPETMFTRPPARMPYNNKRSRYRQYGRNVELMADKALEMTDEDRKHALVTLILNIMKSHLKGQEKDSNAEIIVCDHLRIFTKGRLDYHPTQIEFYKFNAHVQHMQQAQQQHRQQNQRNQGGGKRNYGKNKKKRRR